MNDLYKYDSDIILEAFDSLICNIDFESCYLCPCGDSDDCKFKEHSDDCHLHVRRWFLDYANRKHIKEKP